MLDDHTQTNFIKNREHICEMFIWVVIVNHPIPVFVRRDMPIPVISLVIYVIRAGVTEAEDPGMASLPRLAAIAASWYINRG